MPSLKLKRIYRRYGMLRSLRIEIDRERVVSLECAEEKTIDLPAGNHTLVARMDWAKSRPLTISLQDSSPTLVIADTKSASTSQAVFATFIPPFTVFSLSVAES